MLILKICHGCITESSPSIAKDLLVESEPETLGRRGGVDIGGDPLGTKDQSERNSIQVVLSSGAPP